MSATRPPAAAPASQQKASSSRPRGGGGAAVDDVDDVQRERLAAIALVRAAAHRYRHRPPGDVRPLNPGSCMAAIAVILDLTADRIERGEHRTPQP